MSYGLTYDVPVGKVLRMEKLRQFLNDRPVQEQSRLANEAGTSLGYLRKAISIGQQVNARLAVRLEKATDSAVMRWDLRPDDWREIWPELETHPSAPREREAA